MRNLMIGCTGEDVAHYQERLKLNGFTISVDQCFGNKTDGCTRLFQRLHGLTEDGVIGARTAKCLDESAQTLTICSGWIPTGNKSDPYRVDMFGIPYTIYNQSKQGGKYGNYLVHQGCSICAATTAFEKAGYITTTSNLYTKAKTVCIPPNGDDNTITVWGISILANTLRIPAAWYGVGSNKEYAKPTMDAALIAGKPICITVQHGAHDTFTASNVHTICLLGYDSYGNVIVGNSNNGGRVQKTSLSEVLDCTWDGDCNPPHQTYWFNRKVTSAGFVVIG